MPNKPPPERIYLSMGQQQGSWEMNACWNVRPFPSPAESIEYVPASALAEARREVWGATIALVRSFETGTEIRKTKGFKFKLPYTREVAHVIVKELEAAARREAGARSKPPVMRGRKAIDVHNEE